MLLSTLRSYWRAAAWSAIVAAAVLVGGLTLGARTVDHMIETGASSRAETFAAFLLSDRRRLDALLLGLTRDPDLETKIRTVAALSHVASFSIFDPQGREVFATRSADHDWLLRNRPGGVDTGAQLSQSAIHQQGAWRSIVDGDRAHLVVIMPLLENGRAVAYLAAEIDLSAEGSAYETTLLWASAQLLTIVALSTGAPALLYWRRKRRMKEADERIYFLHNHDALTNLLNRRRMTEEVDRILATARATRERTALWFIDVDGLAEINNMHGQAAGDEVLRVTASRLSEVVDRGDLLSRTGSHDFAILQRAVRNEDQLQSLAHRILATTTKPVALGGSDVTPRVTLGVCQSPDSGRSYSELFRHAELAFQHQKNTRRGDYTLFDPRMDEEAHRRRLVEQMLRAALEDGAFELFYQPIMAGDCETVVGFEALIRMPDGQGGHVPPSVFIPIAESRGYIRAIGTWVIGQAARQAAQWPDHLFVSVNLSAVQFRDGDLVEVVRKALTAAGIQGRQLGIEVVESLLLEQSDEVLEQLRGLRALGVSIDMDDFGTGYSSLGYLWRFPFDKLKIDQSFMRAFDEEKSNAPKVVQTIVSLGHQLGLKVTAEGVETREQAEILRSFGCDQLQGFYFGRPKPANEIAPEMLNLASRRLAREGKGAGQRPGREPAAATARALAN